MIVLRSPLTEKQLLARDAKRDIGAELLLSVRQLKAGKGKVVARVEVPAVTTARMKSGLSQAEFQFAGRLRSYAARLGTGSQATVRCCTHSDHHCRASAQGVDAGFQEPGSGLKGYLQPDTRGKGLMEGLNPNRLKVVPAMVQPTSRNPLRHIN